MLARQPLTLPERTRRAALAVAFLTAAAALPGSAYAAGSSTGSVAPAATGVVMVNRDQMTTPVPSTFLELRDVAKYPPMRFVRV